MLGLKGPEAKGVGSHQEVEGFSLRTSLQGRDTDLGISSLQNCKRI